MSRFVVTETLHEDCAECLELREVAEAHAAVMGARGCTFTDHETDDSEHSITVTRTTDPEEN